MNQTYGNLYLFWMQCHSEQHQLKQERLLHANTVHFQKAISFDEREYSDLEDSEMVEDEPERQVMTPSSFSSDDIDEVLNSDFLRDQSYNFSDQAREKLFQCADYSDASSSAVTIEMKTATSRDNDSASVSNEDSLDI